MQAGITLNAWNEPKQKNKKTRRQIIAPGCEGLIGSGSTLLLLLLLLVLMHNFSKTFTRPTGSSFWFRYLQHSSPRLDVNMEVSGAVCGYVYSKQAGSKYLFKHDPFCAAVFRNLRREHLHHFGPATFGSDNLFLPLCRGTPSWKPLVFFTSVCVCVRARLSSLFFSRI